MSAEMADFRLEKLTSAFGEEANVFDALLVDAAKANFEAYKFKVNALAPVHAKRAEAAKKIKNFWFTSLTNCEAFSMFIDPVDRECLNHLTQIDLVHDEKDVRNFDVKFTFSSKNPFFSETVLTKSLSATPPAGSAAPKPAPYDLEADMYLTSAVPISWTSKDHDLTLKSPRVEVEELEEFDEFNGHGSFFCWFSETGLDNRGLGDDFLEWWSHATEYAAGMPEEDGESEGDSDDEDEESEDGAKEIDLESEEEEQRPKKKSKKST